MRSKKTIINVFISLTLQIIAIICGLIVPRLIINTYGSGVNGLISSINQFLSYIVLLEAGVGGVVRAALYKPLSSNDISSVSKIIKATEKFFKKIAYIFLIYLFIIAVVFPYLVNKDFNSFFTFILILIIGISTFFQYYFGITYQILLQADQRQYVTSIIQIVTMIINTILVVILIKFGFNIQFVKLASSVIFIIRPILLSWYVNKKYNIIKNCKADNNAIKQRWDGFGHHIAFFILENTDIVIITLFMNLKEVSVYSVYFMIISNVRILTVTFSSSIEAAFGNMIAKNEKENLEKNFKIFELLSFTITTILFSSTALLILSFISLYTKGITDINYYRPIFAYIMIFAYAIYCIRVPYNSVVLAAGHYKQTRNGAFVEAMINIVLSIILVKYLGIIGVAIGTFCAMLFRTIQYAIYLSKNIIKRSIFEFVKKVIVYIIDAIIIIFVVNFCLSIGTNSYIEWFEYAIEVTLISCIITFVVNLLFYFDDLKNIFIIIRSISRNKFSNKIKN
ncbi:TPA: lipopolysaccharide biosynthesis protein [Clostridium perfringens]